MTGLIFRMLVFVLIGAWALVVLLWVKSIPSSRTGLPQSIHSLSYLLRQILLIWCTFLRVLLLAPAFVSAVLVRRCPHSAMMWVFIPGPMSSILVASTKPVGWCSAISATIISHRPQATLAPTFTTFGLNAEFEASSPGKPGIVPEDSNLILMGTTWSFVMLWDLADHLANAQIEVLLSFIQLVADHSHTLIAYLVTMNNRWRWWSREEKDEGNGVSSRLRAIPLKLKSISKKKRDKQCYMEKLS